MSCVYRALPRIIPNRLLSAKKSTSVAIVSPWIQDVELQVPILDGYYRRDSRKMYFSYLLNYLVEKRQQRIYLFIRDNDERAKYATRIIRKNNQASLEIFIVQHLHAKAILTNSNILLTSANLIFTSLYRNVESCSLQINPYQNTIKYVEYEFGVRLT